MKPESADLNPHFFHWGTLHTYAAGAALGASHLVGLVELQRDPAYYLERPEEMARLYLVGRALSLLLLLVTVAATCRLGARLGGTTAGWLSGAFLGVCALFVLYGHFFTPDICLTFLFTLSVLLAVRSLQTEGRSPLWHAAAVAGLAASVKYNGALALVGVALAIRPHGVKRALAAGGAFVAGFALGTPYALLAPREFMEGVVWQLAHAASTHGLVFAGTPPGWVYHVISSMGIGLGWPLLAVLGGGTVLSGALGRREGAWRILAGTALAYYAVIGASPLKFSRYVLPLLPLCAVLGAAGWSVLFRRAPRRVALAAGGLVGVGVLWGGLLCVAHDSVLMGRDTRIEAGQWLRTNAAAGDTVLLFGRPYFYTPPVDADRYHVVVSEMEESSLAQVLPDWIVVTDYEYEAFLRLPGQYPGQATLFRRLLAGELHVREYRYEARLFSRRLRVGGIPVSGGVQPHDLRYAYPTVAVLRRTRLAAEKQDRLGEQSVTPARGETRVRGRSSSLLCQAGGASNPAPVLWRWKDWSGGVLEDRSIGCLVALSKGSRSTPCREVLPTLQYPIASAPAASAGSGGCCVARLAFRLEQVPGSVTHEG
jgi:hypothetical protein